jgi:hypothetical protein
MQKETEVLASHNELICSTSRERIGGCWQTECAKL